MSNWALVIFDSMRKLTPESNSVRADTNFAAKGNVHHPCHSPKHAFETTGAHFARGDQIRRDVPRLALGRWKKSFFYLPRNGTAGGSGIAARATL